MLPSGNIEVTFWGAKDTGTDTKQLLHADHARNHMENYILQNSHNTLQYNEYIVDYGLNIIALFLAPLEYTPGV